MEKFVVKMTILRKEIKIVLIRKECIICFIFLSFFENYARISSLKIDALRSGKKKKKGKKMFYDGGT